MELIEMDKKDSWGDKKKSRDKNCIAVEPSLVQTDSDLICKMQKKSNLFDFQLQPGLIATPGVSHVFSTGPWSCEDSGQRLGLDAPLHYGIRVEDHSCSADAPSSSATEIHWRKNVLCVVCRKFARGAFADFICESRRFSHHGQSQAPLQQNGGRIAREKARQWQEWKRDQSGLRQSPHQSHVSGLGYQQWWSQANDQCFDMAEEQAVGGGRAKDTWVRQGARFRKRADPWVPESGQNGQTWAGKCRTWKNGGGSPKKTSWRDHFWGSKKRKLDEAASKAALEPSARASGSADHPASSSSTRKPSETPPELRDLLHPKIRADTKIGLNRDPKGYGYRAFYPSRATYYVFFVFLCFIAHIRTSFYNMFLSTRSVFQVSYFNMGGPFSTRHWPDCAEEFPKEMEYCPLSVRGGCTLRCSRFHLRQVECNQQEQGWAIETDSCKDLNLFPSFTFFILFLILS